MCSACFIVLFKQKTAYELRISDWSSDVCSSDLLGCPTTAGCTTMLSSVVADSKSGLLILPSPHPANIRAANAPKKPTALTALIGSSCPCSLKTNIRFPTRCRIYEIGRSSCRERGCQYVLLSVGAGPLKKKKSN